MRSKHKNSGQSLVEFALTLPVILLCIFVFLDLGRAVYYFSAVTNAVREGARYAVVHKLDAIEEANIRSIVSNYSVAVPIDPATVTIQPGGSEGQYITIAASYQFNPITPFLELILGSGSTIPIHSSSTMLLAPIAQ